MNKWFFPLLILALAFALANSGCKKSAEESTAPDAEIKVGEFASLTGKEAAFGQSSHKGTLLGVDDPLNAAGGVLHGKPIKLIYEDDERPKAGRIPPLSSASSFPAITSWPCLARWPPAGPSKPRRSASKTRSP